MNPLDPLKNWTPPYVSEYSFASIIDDFDSIGDRAVSASDLGKRLGTTTNRTPSHPV